MVNERYDNDQNEEHHEEGEYHFSDDQVNYELDPESVNAGGTVVAAPKTNVMDKLKQNRRIMIGVIVFFILIGLVYKLLVPASTPPSTDISQQALPTTAATAPVATTTTTKTVTKVAERPVIPVQSPIPAAQPAAVQAPAPVASAAPVAAPAAAPMPQQPAVAQQQIAPAAPVNPPVQQPQASTPPAPVNAQPTPVDTSAENNAAMNLLQTEYSQKIAENEHQVNEMRTQLQELNSRVAGMEVSFHQLTKILRTMRSDSPNTMAAAENGENPAMQPQPMRAVQPSHVRYTVQAIIPGRAWLKSDSGDTVTVAEGDELKDVGRITKIDPYDGIVNIDTGSKIITLSYGVTGD